MDIRNRLADISKLRCNICQDFLEMIAKPNWQQELYNKAKCEIENNTRFKDKYIVVYNTMRDYGIDQYSISKMDVTLIVEILYSLKNTFPAEYKTINAINKIKGNKNTKSHSGENEASEELYLQGLLDLCNLRYFVEEVDKSETSIADPERLSFRRKYIPMIDQLKESLDEERIALIYKSKEISKDVTRILTSTDPDKTWIDTHEYYMTRKWMVEKDYDSCFEFFVKASDAGIRQAHPAAMGYFLTIKKDVAEAERRLYMLLDAYENLPIYLAKEIVSTLNECIIKQIELEGDISSILNRLQEQGYNVKTNQNGFYYIDK